MHVKEGFCFTPPKRVTSPTWGPPPPCKQALNQQQLMQKADMPGLVDSFFEIHKTGINLFHVIMNPLNVVSIKVRKYKDMVCCAVI